MSEAVAGFWRRFLDESGTADRPYRTCAFAEEYPDVATELGRLVLEGTKRATTGLLAEYEETGEALPVAGDLWIVVDGGGVPLCVVRTTAVECRRYAEVDEAFAFEEGENDRTLAGWCAAHERYFASVGRPVAAETMLVLERFEKLWP